MPDSTKVLYNKEIPNAAAEHLKNPLSMKSMYKSNDDVPLHSVNHRLRDC